ncbi:hypothetical protein U9M48_005004 [Paspalum notatum var. saurae]|uniref:Uncharacterized protein n=1 Tax=Paspalum notatum var. saurae TaxID=547442 RepID=A0AAQ3PWP4_PASNO
MQRNATSDETSSGSPTRRCGVRRRMLSKYSSLDRTCRQQSRPGHADLSLDDGEFMAYTR